MMFRNQISTQNIQQEYTHDQITALLELHGLRPEFQL